MITDSVVRARIDGHTKEVASHVLAEMGLSVSDAIRILLVRVAAEKALPFDIRVPNAETIAAMDEGDRTGREVRDRRGADGESECGRLNATAIPARLSKNQGDAPLQGYRWAADGRSVSGK